MRVKRHNPSKTKKTLREVAEDLVKAHRKIDPSMSRAFFVDDPSHREVRLIEVTEEVPDVEDGLVVPIPVGARPDKGVPYPSAVVLLHPDEYKRFSKGKLWLPDDWGCDPFSDEIPLT